jgi:hypothetical protein
MRLAGLCTLLHGQTSGPITRARAIILIIDPRADELADPALVRDVSGLTLGKDRVAALVGSSLPPRESALRLGIADETAPTSSACFPRSAYRDRVNWPRC